jgi:predicted phosphodiesterase
VRVYAVSDVHVDFEPNAQWVQSLPRDTYDDVLILAGDVSDHLDRLRRCLDAVVARFARVMFVPGNHDLWVLRESPRMDSFDKFNEVCRAAADCGAHMDVFHDGSLSIVPLLGWYDGSFGEPGDRLLSSWVDFVACRWPDGFDDRAVTRHFLAMNTYQRCSADEVIVSFSHFLPRLDVMPAQIPREFRFVYPVLGSDAIGEQVAALGSEVHVYGHSHVNRRVTIDGTLFVNNAFGYPQETRIAAKALACVYEKK